MAPKGSDSYEKPGEITSDSLAAESLNSGGDFASNVPGKTVASSVPSKSTTANTRDTSGVDVIPAAADRESRDGGYDGHTTIGQRTGYEGPHVGANEGGNIQLDGSAYNSAPGNTTTSKDTTSAPTSSNYQQSSNTATSGSNSSSGASGETLKPKPKGQNITEGGFDSDAPNGSFNNDVGGENDPARVALGRMERANAGAGADAGYEGVGLSKESGKDLGGFENLNSEEAA